MYAQDDLIPKPRLRLQPMVHVHDLAKSVIFFETLGGELIYGSRDGDWALMDFAGARLALLAREPGDTAPDRVEIQFTSESSLEEIEELMALRSPDRIARGVADEAFGRMIKLTTPDGLLVKVLELDRTLIE